LGRAAAQGGQPGTKGGEKGRMHGEYIYSPN
jgi:hypothetical protein